MRTIGAIIGFLGFATISSKYALIFLAFSLIVVGLNKIVEYYLNKI